MAVNTVNVARNLQSDTTRGLSQGIWADCPIAAIQEDPGIGMFVYNDFTQFRVSSNVNAAEAYWADGFMGFGDNGGFINTNDEHGGSIKLGSDGDNEGASIRQATAPFQISRSYKKLWFEVRMKKSTIADTKHGVFVGLAEATAFSATVPIAAAGTLADINFVGFHGLEGDGDMLDTVYKADAVTQVTVAADAVTLVADTYIKVGFTWDPKDLLAVNQLAFYSNNLRLATAKTIPSAAGTDFPNDVRLGIVLAVLNATGTTPGYSAFDWVACAQLF